MEKPIIAVDIDDVLSRTAQAFVNFSNRTWGHRLTITDYTEDYGKAWGTLGTQTEERAAQFHTDAVFDSFGHHVDAVDVLLELSHSFQLVIATSRRLTMEAITKKWLDRHYGGLFDGVYFAGIYDVPGDHAVKLRRTKSELLKEVRADYLIDDQLKHCIAAAGQGMVAILFGDYPWNQLAELPDGVTRCRDWAEVGAYFDGRSAK